MKTSNLISADIWRSRKVQLSAGLAALIFGFFILWLFSGRPPLTKISYDELVIRRGDISISILSNGFVQPDNRIQIKPPVAGRVDEVLVEEGEMVKRGQVLAWMSSSERAALIDAARADGPEAVKQWEEDFKPIPVLAPSDGTVILRQVEPGQTLAAADGLFDISDRLVVKAQVDETDIAQIKLKQPAIVVLDAYSKNQIEAEVLQVAFDAKTVNSVTTYAVDVLPRKRPDFMRSGMTANISFIVANQRGVLLVPNIALYAKGDSRRVLVKTPGGNEERELEIGLSDAQNSEVKKGLTEGDIVLVARVRIEEAPPRSPFSPFGQRDSSDEN